MTDTDHTQNADLAAFRRSQREHILAALARGNGQQMAHFDTGHTAEIMYGDQADQIEALIASEQRAVLRFLADEIEREANQLRGLPSDKVRRQELHRLAKRLRDHGRMLTKSAQARYDKRREAAQSGAVDLVRAVLEDRRIPPVQDGPR